MWSCWSLPFATRLHGSITAEHILCIRIAVESEPMIHQGTRYHAARVVTKLALLFVETALQPRHSMQHHVHGLDPANVSSMITHDLDPTCCLRHKALLPARPACKSLPPVAAPCVCIDEHHPLSYADYV